MAKVKITGHASGTGVITVTAPNTSTDRTITLPDSTGTILDNTSTLDATKLSGNLPAISGASLTNIPPQGRKNIIINGDFRINQRGLTTSAAAVTNGAYNIDRMQNYLIGVSGTVALGDAEAVNGTYETPLKYTAGSTASGRLGGFQAVEDYHYGETLTASAWVKSDNANARIVAYDGSTLTSSNTHTGGGAWELLKVTFTQRTNPDQLYIWTAIISATVGSVSIASGDYIYISKFQCERGSVATDFERLHKGEQLALCQRYYYQDIKGTTQEIGVAWYYSNTHLSWIVNFPVPMRASPSMDYSGPTDGWTVYRNSGGDNFTTMTLENVNYQYTRASMFNNTQVSGTAGQAGVLRGTNSNSLLSFSAEL